MKKINKKILPLEIPPVIFYKEDLLGLLDIIGINKLLKFQADDFEFELDGGRLTDDEIKKFPKNFSRKVMIKANFNDDNIISIDFYENYIILDVFRNRDDHDILGLTSQIEHYLQNEKRFLCIPIFYQALISMVISLIFSFLLFLLLEVVFKINFLLMPLVVLLIQQLVYFCSLKFLKEKSENIIYLKTTKEEKPNFWQRNKDRIIVGIIISIPSLLIGYFISLLTKK